MRLNSISYIVLLSILLTVSITVAQESENVELVGQVLYPDDAGIIYYWSEGEEMAVISWVDCPKLQTLA